METRNFWTNFFEICLYSRVPSSERKCLRNFFFPQKSFFTPTVHGTGFKKFSSCLKLKMQTSKADPQLLFLLAFFFSVAFVGLFYSKKSHLWQQKSHKKSLRDNILSSKTKQKNSPFHFDLIHALLFCVFVSSWDHFQTTMMSASRRTRF